MKIITIKRASDSAIISTIAQIGNPASEIMSKCATKKICTKWCGEVYANG